jgi:hypothetical protein
VGDETVKNRFFLIVLALILLVIIVIAASLGSTRKTTVKTEGLLTCTVESEIGIETITITNQNTQKNIIRSDVDLPFTFNFTAGDTLKFNVTTIAGYKWNAWLINQAPWFADNNPFTFKPTDDIVLTPQVNIP